MIDEKKLPDDALDAVTGGTDDDERLGPRAAMAQQTWDRVKKDLGINNNTNSGQKDQQP